MALSRLRGIALEMQCARHLQWSSRPRYVGDVLLYRALRLGAPPRMNSTRTIVLRDGTCLSYRLNRGDIQAIREVWFVETYRPPFRAEHFKTLVDLGANIGFTSVYFAKRYGVRVVVAVEPDAGNARLLRRNLQQNNIAGIVLEAAVGDRDGMAFFAESRQSNLGRVAESGISIQMLSMNTVLAALSNGTTVDILKVDIEGGEGVLFAGDVSWLARVGSLMIEFHGEVVDDTPIIAKICSRGFDYVPPGSVHRGSTDAFVRPPRLDA